MSKVVRKRPIIVTAGGTGGHVIPALSIAKELQARGWPVVWLGTRAGIEARLVPEAGLPVRWISVSGVRGKGKAALLLAPFKLTWAVMQALWHILRVRPAALVGAGGFVSGPGGLAAWLLRKPILVQEQNAIAGKTNTYLGKLAKVVAGAFPGAFGRKDVGKYRVTGNPIREEISAIEAQRLEGRSGFKVQVLGGSLGARALNELLPQVWDNLKHVEGLKVHHQCGPKNLDAATKAYEQVQHVDVEVAAYVDDMATAYADADLFVCRAGASTITELAASGTPALCVPFPAAVDDHQTKNAGYLEREGAAVIAQERDLTPEKLTSLLEELLHREKLIAMGHAAKKAAKPTATQDIADLVEAIALKQPLPDHGLGS